jgi:quercetin dioxygenase-like cupin family protein
MRTCAVSASLIFRPDSGRSPECLFTKVLRRGILRTSPKRSAKKLGGSSNLFAKGTMTPLGVRRREHPVVINKKILVGPGEGAYLPVLDIIHKVTAANLGGAFTVIEVGLDPGEMIPPHIHTHEDECAFVLEGELTFDVGGEVVLAPAGSFVIKPRGALPLLLQHGHGAQPPPGDTII